MIPKKTTARILLAGGLRFAYAFHVPGNCINPL
jgi:hypothetical protein